MILMLCNTADLTRFSTETDCYVGYYGSRGVIYIARKRRKWHHRGPVHQLFYLYILTHLGLQPVYNFTFFFFNFLATFETFWYLTIKTTFSSLGASTEPASQILYYYDWWSWENMAVCFWVSPGSYTNDWKEEVGCGLGPGHTFWTTEEFLKCHAVPPTYQAQKESYGNLWQQVEERPSQAGCKLYNQLSWG